MARVSEMPDDDGPAKPRSLRPEERGVPQGLQGLVSRALRGGTVLAVILVIIGMILVAFRGGPNLMTPSTTFSLVGLVSGVAHLAPFDFLLLGLLVLVLTPVSRVVISVALFSASGDRQFMWLTITVLTVLVLSVVVGVIA